MHQTLASNSLLALAIFNIPERVLRQASVDVTDPAQSALKEACNGIEGGMVFFLMVPVLVLPFLSVVSRRDRKRAAASASGNVLEEPLLDSVRTPPSRLVSNSRGLRLTHGTPNED